MKKWLIGSILVCIAAFIWLPLWMLLSGTIMGSAELYENLVPVLEGGEGTAVWPVIAQYPTLQAYVELLLDTPQFFTVFWNSCRQVLPIILGHVLLGAPAAWAFARFHFRGKKILYTLYIVLMLMPFQVTMVPNVLTLRKLGLLNTVWAVILPNCFAPFYIFLLRQYMVGLPGEILEAAEIDGAGTFRCFLHVVLPVCKPIIGCAVALSFADCWNLVEQPLAYLAEQTDKMPRSVMFNQLTQESSGVEFAGAGLYILPALFV